MLGGGFIGQMHQTNKQNREMLKKEKRKPFEKASKVANADGEVSKDKRNLTDQERGDLINGVKLEARKERRKKQLILMVSVVLTALILGWLYWKFAGGFVQFWS